MPNALGHFGIQGLASRALFGRVDPRWVLTGCILPDVPWIAQRVTNAVAPGADPYAVRLYFVGQASLLGTVVLCGAVASLAPKPRRIFLLLAFHALLHLLLDACQTKWGNGVHLLAPLSWDHLNFGLFWPEQWPSLLLTGGGLVYVAWASRTGLWSPFHASARRLWACALLLVCYAVLPALWQPSAYEANVHDARTLKENRVGESVAFDREELVRATDGPRLHVWNRQLYAGQPAFPAHEATVSLRGRLAPGDRIEVAAFYEHAGNSRDYGSVVGLAVWALALGVGIFRARTSAPHPTSKEP